MNLPCNTIQHLEPGLYQNRDSLYEERFERLAPSSKYNTFYRSSRKLIPYQDSQVVVQPVRYLSNTRGQSLDPRYDLRYQESVKSTRAGLSWWEPVQDAILAPVPKEIALSSL
jgi:hypothetical protein